MSVYATEQPLRPHSTPRYLAQHMEHGHFSAKVDRTKGRKKWKEGGNISMSHRTSECFNMAFLENFLFEEISGINSLLDGKINT